MFFGGLNRFPSGGFVLNKPELDPYMIDPVGFWIGFVGAKPFDYTGLSPNNPREGPEPFAANKPVDGVELPPNIEGNEGGKGVLVYFWVFGLLKPKRLIFYLSTPWLCNGLFG